MLCCWGQGGTNPEKREFTVSVVFVMSKDGAPPEGELVGDILYVPVPEGYRNIVLKTKAMLCLVRPPAPWRARRMAADLCSPVLLSGVRRCVRALRGSA